MEQPLLGLMTTDLPRPTATRLPPTWELLSAVGREAEIPILFFHPHQMALGANSVSGFRQRANGSWWYGRTKLPHLIVDQVFVHIARLDPQYAALKRSLRARGIPVLNPRLPDKRGVWRALSDSPALAAHLPATDSLLRAEEAIGWLTRYPSVFLKPVRGSKGQGVLCISRAEDGLFTIAEQKRRTVDRAQLLQLIAAQLKRTPHLIQQGVSLVEVGGCKIDLRVVLFRDGERRWRPVTTVPRAGQAGQAVTNLARGGRIEPLSWLEAEMNKRRLNMPTREQIEQVAILTAEALTPIRPTLAFLGIDIGLTTDGELYPLDINPRPGRQALSMADRKAAYQHLLAFCTTIAPPRRKAVPPLRSDRQKF
ncbi:YheC/YheD family protein [Tumebacillus lipolyticus]|uniref:YheC/YheD family protein n=1 Tax=Tumebacillus lipolyticus TaxID=1280370 RepID=A0ABW4ZXK8_9BACL